MNLKTEAIDIEVDSLEDCEEESEAILGDHSDSHDVPRTESILADKREEGTGTMAPLVGDQIFLQETNCESSDDEGRVVTEPDPLTRVDGSEERIEPKG